MLRLRERRTIKSCALVGLYCVFASFLGGSAYALDRDEAITVLQSSDYFPRYRVIELPIGDHVNIEVLISGTRGVSQQVSQEFNVGYACARKLGYLQFRPVKFGFEVRVTEHGQSHGWVVAKNAYSYSQFYVMPVYDYNVSRVSGIKTIDSSSSYVEFEYGATDILDAGRCVWPNIDRQKEELGSIRGKATLGNFDDGWRVESVSAEGKYQEWVTLDREVRRLSRP